MQGQLRQKVFLKLTARYRRSCLSCVYGLQCMDIILKAVFVRFIDKKRVKKTVVLYIFLLYNIFVLKERLALLMNNNNYRRAPQRTKKRKSGFPLSNILIIVFLFAVLSAVVVLALSNRFSDDQKDETDFSASFADSTSVSSQTVKTDAGSDEPLTYTEMTLLSAGDVMYHSPQIEAAYNSATGEYDFSDTYQYIGQVVSSADLSVVNFETTLAGPDYEYAGYPTFNTPDSGLSVLLDTGFDMMLFANNHCYDKLTDDVMRTQQMFNEYGVHYI